jgi:hypothetical protein
VAAGGTWVALALLPGLVWAWFAGGRAEAGVKPGLFVAQDHDATRGLVS